MGDDILIAYYSWQGNTRKIASLIQNRTKGTLFEIKMKTPYSTDYGTVVKQAKEEIRAGVIPELVSLPDKNSYSTVFIGTPNWWHTMAPPLAAFLQSYDMSNKTVIPFCTHGGGGKGTIEKDAASMCPSSTFKNGFVTYNDGGRTLQADIDAWLKALNFNF